MKTLGYGAIWWKFWGIWWKFWGTPFYIFLYLFIYLLGVLEALNLLGLHGYLVGKMFDLVGKMFIGSVIILTLRPKETIILFGGMPYGKRNS